MTYVPRPSAMSTPGITSSVCIKFKFYFSFVKTFLIKNGNVSDTKSWKVFSSSVTSSHLSLSKCLLLRPQCCRWGCQEDQANHSIFCYSLSFGPESSRCLTAIATLILQPFCQAVDVHPLPENDKKFETLKYTSWLVDCQLEETFHLEKLKTAERQFFNFDLRYLSVHPTLPFTSRQVTTLVSSPQFFK